MAIYELSTTGLTALEQTTFAQRGVRERQDLQRLLRDHIDAVAPGVLVIAEEFGDFEDSKRRIDLLGVDTEAILVVIEFKRSEDGGHMELQALRYAAMVSTLTFAQAERAFAAYLTGLGKPADRARETLLEHLGWDEPREAEFAQDVRMVLVAAEFSRELTASVMWLGERDLDLRCVRLRPHQLEEKLLLDVQQVLPLPEAKDYQVRIREKAQNVREARRAEGAWSGYYFVNIGEDQQQCWEDCRDHAYIAAGGGQRWLDEVSQLRPGDRFFAYLNGHGYVGYGEVLAPPVPLRDFKVAPAPAVGAGGGAQPGKRKLLELPLRRQPNAERRGPDDVMAYHGVAVRWLTALDREDAVAAPPRRHAICRLLDDALARRLREALAPPPPPPEGAEEASEA